MKKADLSVLSKDQMQKLISILKDKVDKAFRAGDSLTYIKDVVEAAIDWSWQNKFPSSLLTNNESSSQSTFSGALSLNTPAEEDYRNESDEYALELRDPFLSRMFLGWTRAIKNNNLNPNNNWFEINREYSKFFKDQNLLEFLPQANEAMVNYHTKEAKRFGLRQKYAKSIPEFVAHGYTGGIMKWNSQDLYAEPVWPGTRNFAIYPITDDLRRVSRVYRFPTTYLDLIEDPRFDKNLTKYVKPMMNSSVKQVADQSGKDFDSGYQEENSIVVHQVNMPFLFIEEDGEYEEVFIKNPMFTILFQPPLKNSFAVDKPNHGITDLILCAYSDCASYETGEVIGCFQDTLPNDFPGKGPLIPYLHDQAHLNQLKQAHVRLVEMLADPAWSEEYLDDMDTDETEDQELGPGQRFRNKKIELLIPTEVVAGINSLIQAKKMLQEDGESTHGINRNLQGQPLPGRRSAEEVETMNNAGSASKDDVVIQYDDVILKPMSYIKTAMTQNALKQRVYDLLGISSEEEEDQALVEAVLQDDELFQRIKNWSQIDALYEDYYREYTQKYEEEQRTNIQAKLLDNELEELDNKLEEMQMQLAQSEDEEQAAMLEQEYNVMMQQRDQMLGQYQAMIDSNQSLELIPEPSDYLYFKMWTDPLLQSDVDAVAGTASMKSRDERDTIEMFLNYTSKIPEMGMKTDFRKIINKIAKMLKMKPSEFLKRPSQLRKIDSMLDKQMEASVMAPPQQ
jgi:hypothetical protein